MTPNTTSVTTPGGVNIDQMLQSLSKQQEPVSSNTSSGGIANAQQNFSIESLSKPIPTATSVADVTLPKPAFILPKWLRMVGSLVATVLVLVIGGWVFSKQYPVETDLYIAQIFGIADSVVSTTTQNIIPDVIENQNEQTGGNIDLQVHNVATDYVADNTPLSNALSAAQDTLGQDTSIEKTLGESLSDSDSPIVESTKTGISLPVVSETFTKEELQDKLLALSSSAQEAITNLTDDTTSKGAIMSVIYKKSQGLLLQLSDSSFIVTSGFSTQVEQLQALYEKTITQ